MNSVMNLDIRRAEEKIEYVSLFILRTSFNQLYPVKKDNPQCKLSKRKPTIYYE